MQPVLTVRQSLELYRNMLAHSLAQAVRSHLAPVELWVTGAHDYWAELAKQYDFKLFFQHGNDLGERMAYAIKQGLSSGKSVVVIGTDCPFVDVDYLKQALKALGSTNPVVVGPARDGGYVLLGLNQFSARLFNDIPWGTEQVLNLTMQQIKEIGWRCTLLAELNDIDRPEDLVHLQRLFPQWLAGIAR